MTLHVSLLTIIFIGFVVTIKLYDKIFKDQEEFEDSCPSETIISLIASEPNSEITLFYDPYEVCLNIKQSCCSKEIFTQGYVKFNTLLRNPIINRLEAFKEIQKMLYDIDLNNLQTILLNARRRKPQCVEYKGDLVKDFSKVKMAKSNIQSQITNAYNNILQLYSSMLCAICNSNYKSAFTPHLTEIDGIGILKVTIKAQTCTKYITSQVLIIEALSALHPLFILSRTLKCLSGIFSDHLYRDFDLTLLNKRKDFYKSCLDQKNINDINCIILCTQNIDFTAYNDNISLLANINDAYKTLYLNLLGEPSTLYIDSGLGSIDTPRFIKNELSLNHYEVYGNYKTLGFLFEVIELEVQKDSGINLGDDLMKRDYYKSVGIWSWLIVTILHLIL